jgi:hypothetical protein
VIRNSKGAYDDAVTKQSVRFPSIDGDLRIPDINAPIENTLTVTAVPNGGPQGTLKVTGTADVIEGNEVRVEQGNVDETVEVQGVDMATVAAFLPPGTIDRIEGTTNAVVSVKLAAGQSALVQAQVTTTNLAATGPALKGDTFAARELSIVVPPTTIDMSAGFGGKPENWPVRTAPRTSRRRSR